MPESNDGNKEFLTHLRTAGSIEDLTSGKRVTLCGAVYRSGEGTFAVVSDGQVLELPVTAVDRFKVVGTGLNPAVEISVSAEAVKGARTLGPKPVLADGGAGTAFALDHKSLVTDPLTDKVLHKDIVTDPIADKYAHKDIATDHVTDKQLWKDVHKDPITDPVNTGWGDQGGSLAEQPGVDPAQGAINPVAGMTPFVMATPHQAPSPMVNQQMGYAQQRMVPGVAALKSLHADTLKELSSDNTLKEVIRDTHKEVIFDTFKEVPADTHKEIYETTVEGGGSWQEGGGQIAGGFPGMPGF